MFQHCLLILKVFLQLFVCVHIFCCKISNTGALTLLMSQVFLMGEIFHAGIT